MSVVVQHVDGYDTQKSKSEHIISRYVVEFIFGHDHYYNISPVFFPNMPIFYDVVNTFELLFCAYNVIALPPAKLWHGVNLRMFASSHRSPMIAASSLAHKQGCFIANRHFVSLWRSARLWR